MNRRRVSFLPPATTTTLAADITASSTSIRNKKQRRPLNVRGLAIAVCAALSTFLLFAFLKEPSGTPKPGSYKTQWMPKQHKRGAAETAPSRNHTEQEPSTFAANNGKEPHRPLSSSSSSTPQLPPSEPSKELPAWIQNYLRWHQEQRAAFPGMKLFQDPAAPKLLIRTCLGLCGGLHDRLGQLPWDLYLANQTNRLLLMHWHRPVPLEHFLVPHQLDWRVPREVPGFFHPDGGIRVGRRELKIVRGYPELFQGFGSERPTDDFWDEHLDHALERAVSGSSKNERVLRHRILGHLNEDRLEERLAALGETDMLHWTLSFGNIFWMFFRPAPGVQEELDTVHRDLNLTPGHYSAVHCRVRHPKATNTKMQSKDENYPADKVGLPWEGESRKFAVETATRALRCAKTLLEEPTEPVYLFSDSNDLVRYMSHELKNTTFVTGNATLLRESPVDSAALKVVETTNVLARQMTLENAHIDRQKGRDPPAYYATFVDLLLAINSRCVTYGIGFYAVFATKISGVSCKLLYQEEAWGGSEAKRQNTDHCTL